MQTDLDSQRITAIGAPADRVVTTGNLKYDIPFRQVDDDEKKRLRAIYALPEDVPVFTAASTHAGEEQYIINAYQTLLKSCRELFLVLVPRHPERSAEVSILLERSGLPFRRRTSLKDGERLPEGTVLLVDTVGEMMNLYALSDIAFVGGSLVPTGGHNLLEPASVGVACLFGPHMSNFREIAALVLQYQAGVQIQSQQELTDVCRKLLINKALRLEYGRNGLKMMTENGGATGRHMEIIGTYL